MQAVCRGGVQVGVCSGRSGVWFGSRQVGGAAAGADVFLLVMEQRW